MTAVLPVLLCMLLLNKSYETSLFGCVGLNSCDI